MAHLAAVMDDAREALVRAQAGEMLGPAELRAIFRMSKSQFFSLQKAGAFARFELHPPIGLRRYSGALVARYLNGEAMYSEKVKHR